MAAQRQELTVRNFNYSPTTLDEALKYAEIIANSGICPQNFKGRPKDVFIILQTGAELGLSSMQALRCIGVINGMPFIFGDGFWALIKRHPTFEDANEWYEGEMEKSTLTAFCTIKVKNKEPVTKSFSMEEAKTAGLLKKGGVWNTYLKRMLQWKARNFCSRDALPDALFGLPTEQEAQEIYDSKKVEPVPQPKSKGMAGLEESLGIVKEEEVIEAEFTPVQSIPSKLDELKELIAIHKIKLTSINAYLKGCKVESIENLNEEQIDKWINHLKSKEKVNAV